MGGTNKGMKFTEKRDSDVKSTTLARVKCYMKTWRPVNYLYTPLRPACMGPHSLTRECGLFRDLFPGHISHSLVVAFRLDEGESHEAGLLTLLEIRWQEIAVAQVWEELLGPASRLGLHGPLPRAQELGLRPAVDYAVAVLVELIDSSSSWSRASLGCRGPRSQLENRHF